MRLPFLLVLIGMIASPSPAAQGRRGKFSTELTSLNELHIETGPLSELAQRCGLTVADLEPPAKAALETSRLRLAQTASDFIFVNANVIVAGDLCAAAIDVELFRFSRDFGTSVSVWAHEAVIAGGRSGFNARVRDKVEVLTKEFVAEWQKARK